jgi:hypothetical protein
MHMPLNRRTQILLDEARYTRLEERAVSTGASVGALIRRAIDIAYPAALSDRERAGQELLDAEPIAVGDWPDLKRELLDAHSPRG